MVCTEVSPILHHLDDGGGKIEDVEAVRGVNNGNNGQKQNGKGEGIESFHPLGSRNLELHEYKVVSTTMSAVNAQSNPESGKSHLSTESGSSQPAVLEGTLLVKCDSNNESSSRGDSDSTQVEQLSDQTRPLSGTSEPIGALEVGAGTGELKELGAETDGMMYGLVEAAQAGDVAAVRAWLMAGGHVETRDEKLGMTALGWASRQGHLQVVKLLLDHGANIEAGDCRLRTALHRACASGSHGIVKELLTRGACVDPMDSTHRTPLHQAARWGSPECALLLLDAGADIEARDAEMARTPMHYACRQGGLVVTVLLLENGADLNSKTAVGNTALHLACDRGLAACVRLLLQWGALPNEQNHAGKTPAEVPGPWVHDNVKKTLTTLLSSPPPVIKHPKVVRPRPPGAEESDALAKAMREASHEYKRDRLRACSTGKMGRVMSSGYMAEDCAFVPQHELDEAVEYARRASLAAHHVTVARRSVIGDRTSQGRGYAMNGMSGKATPGLSQCSMVANASGMLASPTPDIGRSLGKASQGARRRGGRESGGRLAQKVDSSKGHQKCCVIQ